MRLKPFRLSRVAKGTIRFLALIAFVACDGNIGRAAAAGQGDKVFAVEIVAPVDASGTNFLPHAKPFQVRFANQSDQPITIWSDSCERGHSILSFRSLDPKGETLLVQKRTVPANVWTNYPPKTVEILPNKTYVVEVNLSDFFWGGREWENVPEPNTGTEIEITAVFDIEPTKEATADHVWTGHIESPPLKALVLNPKLKTPQDYLWNACPEQALKMCKADPSWISNAEPEYQCTPLHHAVRFGYKDVVVWLIQNGADVNAAAYNGFTPLHMVERKDIAEILIKAGARLDQKDTWGKTPLQHAAEERKPEVVDAILNSNHKLDLYTAILLKRRDVAIKMLVQDPNVIVGGDGGSDLGGNATPLGLAAGQGDMELVKLLLEAGAPINDQTDCVRFGGYATPLCNAVWAGKVDVVEFLLKNGATTDVVGGKFYRSITEFAEKNSDKKIKELLTKYKSNPSAEFEREMPKLKNKLPGRIASGEFKLPASIKLQ